MQDETVGVCPFSGARADEPTPRRGVSRRSVLGAALSGLALAPTLSGLGGVAQAAPKPKPPTGSTSTPTPTTVKTPRGAHAQVPRGLDIAAKKGRAAEGRFGLMFKHLPAFAPSDTALDELALAMNDGKQPLHDVKDSDVEYDIDDIPAGYIYFGQFVDHDMTRDTTPLTQQEQDPQATVNFDSPRFDLESVYGKGPAGSPELYADAAGRLEVDYHDLVHDLPRDSSGVAFVGDPRNDENLIVAQLHVVFLRLHNRLMDAGLSFEAARTRVRYLFQWVIVHDWLPRIVGQATVDAVLRPSATRITTANLYYKPKNALKPYMPIEYSGAAFRFGHSMIRAEYEVQDGHTVPIFGPDGYEDLRGNRRIPETLWIDWNYFFEIPGMSSPDDRNMARHMDTQISLPLFALPSTVVARTRDAIIELARRNLLRGKRLGVPSGQDVAKAMGVPPLTNAQLALTSGNPALKGYGQEWDKLGKAPLWYYVLKEAELLRGGRRLGPVGGRIVAEVVLGILAADPASYFNAAPGFVPDGGPGFGMGDLVLLADAIDPRAREAAKPEDPALEEPDVPEDPVVGDVGALSLPPEEQVVAANTTPVDSASLLTP